MKNLPFYLILILALAGLYWFQRSQSEAPTPDLSKKTETTTISGRNQREDPVRPIVGARAFPSTDPSSDTKNRYAKKPTEEVVDFKVVNGLAIAYGDTLLGRVPPDFDGNAGRNESPRLQFWDKPEIAYIINPNLPEPQRVQKAIDYFNQHTAAHFVPYDGSQKDGIVFEPGEEECLSYLGRMGGMQPIRLVKGCGTQEIMHEMMHALGFIHEQSRPDRDQFVDVLWLNIEERFQSQFAIVPDSLLEAERDSPFDYRSIMMYRPTIFAAHPGQPTMQSKTPNQINPVSEGLSESDIARVNHLYGAGN